jgi:uncharacterized protein (TIGR02284 family)
MDNEHRASLAILNLLIASCRDAEQGFQTAAGDSISGEYAEQFVLYAKQRGQFVRELQARVRELGGEPADSGTVAGVVHRGWMDLKSAAASSELHALLQECERGEDITTSTYRDALQSDRLDPESRRIVQRQYEAVQAVHDRVKQLRDRAAAFQRR